MNNIYYNIVLLHMMRDPKPAYYHCYLICSHGKDSTADGLFTPCIYAGETPTASYGYPIYFTIRHFSCGYTDRLQSGSNASANSCLHHATASGSVRHFTSGATSKYSVYSVSHNDFEYTSDNACSTESHATWYYTCHSVG